MSKIYQDFFTQYNYESLLDRFPLLQKPVYYALKELTENRFLFELQQVAGSSQTLSWNRQELDETTSRIVYMILSQMMQDVNIALTQADVVVGYLRMNEMLLLRQLVEQNAIQVQVNPETGQEHYMIPALAQRHQIRVRQKRRLWRGHVRGGF